MGIIDCSDRSQNRVRTTLKTRCAKVRKWRKCTPHFPAHHPIPPLRGGRWGGRCGIASQVVKSRCGWKRG